MLLKIALIVLGVLIGVGVVLAIVIVYVVDALFDSWSRYYEE